MRARASGCPRGHPTRQQPTHCTPPPGWRPRRPPPAWSPLHAPRCRLPPRRGPAEGTQAAERLARQVAAKAGMVARLAGAARAVDEAMVMEVLAMVMEVLLVAVVMADVEDGLAQLVV